MLDPTTRCPAAASRSRMSAPLVSLSGVFVSEMVSTQHPSVFGAVDLCSSGVALRVESAVIGSVEKLDDVQDLHVPTVRA
jgi:hypothetical protein